MEYIFTFSLLIGLLTELAGYYFILLILAFGIRITAGPIKFLYKKLFRITDYI